MAGILATRQSWSQISISHRPLHRAYGEDRLIGVGCFNGHPEAIATVTPVGRVVTNEQDHSATLIQNDRAIACTARGHIYNLDLSAMPVGADFNVAVNQEIAP